MKKVLVLAFALIIAFAGVSFAKGLSLEKKSGDYTVIVEFDKNPPVNGANTAEITIKDSAGAIVKGAEVGVEYSMPAMPGMPAMNYKTVAEAAGDAYSAKIDFTMSGPWTLTIKAKTAGKTVTAKFNVDAR